MTTEFNSRELATLTWLVIIAAFLLAKSDIRIAFWLVVKALGSPVLLAAVMVAAAWFVGLVYLAAHWGWWSWELRNDTVVAVIAGAFTVLNSTDQVAERYFRRALRRSVEVGALIGAFVGVEAFSYPVELVLIAVGTTLGLLSVAGRGPEHQPVRHLAEWLLALLGIVIVVTVAWQLAHNSNASDAQFGFALPLWMTVGAIPLSYAFGLFVQYEQAFKLLSWKASSRGWPRSALRRSQLAMVLILNVQARHVRAWSEPWVSHSLTAQSAREAREVMRIFKVSWAGIERERHYSYALLYLKDWAFPEEDRAPHSADVFFDALSSEWKKLDCLQQEDFVREVRLQLLDDDPCERLHTLPGWEWAEARVERLNAF